jgi:sodium transport system permease protein
MKAIFHVAAKEFLDTIRDRRTLLSMIVIPLLLFPVLMGIVNQVQETTEAKKTDIGISGAQQAPGLEKLFTKAERFRLHSYGSEEQLRTLVQHDSLDAGLHLDSTFQEQMARLGTSTIQLIFKESTFEKEEEVQALFDRYEQLILQQRLAKLDIQRENIEPLSIQKQNLSSEQEVLGKRVGGFLPYIFVLFAFIGSMYPAIDLFSGEKERGTIETLLTLPVNRQSLLAGKMVVIVGTGLTSAILSVVGLYLGLYVLDISAELKDMINGILTFNFIGKLFSLMLPLSIFFSGLLIPFSIYARSFKEAQSLITPLQLLVILPIFIGLMPGIAFNTLTAVIPVVNVALATKEILAGTLELSLFLLAFASLIALAVLSVLVSARYFDKESHVLR